MKRAAFLITALLTFAAHGKTLTETLHDDLGAGSIALLGTPAGLIAVAADGKQQRLVTGIVTNVLVDARAKVVWYRTSLGSGRSDVAVLDLLATDAKPIVIAKSVDDMQSVSVRHVDPTESLSAVQAVAGLFVVVARSPFIEARRIGKGKGVRASACKVGATDCAVLTPEGEAFVKELAARSKGARLDLPMPTSARLPRVPVVADKGCCKRCGEAHALPGTTWQAVYTIVFEDCCHVVPQLYDPQTKQFARPTGDGRKAQAYQDGGAQFGNAFLCKAGDVYVSGGAAYRYGADGAIQKGDRNGGGGCLDGGWFFAGDEINDCGRCANCQSP